MRYYLETNSVRKWSSSFSNAFLKQNCFTTVHTLCELLTDLRCEKEYKIKRNALIAIFDNGIAIDWDFPHKKQLEIYGIKNTYNKITEKEIMNIFTVMKSNTDKDNFIKKVSNREYSTVYEKICNYDSHYFKNFFYRNGK
jgi:hypothetical protein